jgi:hypothetical protein
VAASNPAVAARYWDAILAEAPRVLSLMDREPQSPTRGCCDRTYWAWKFVDFPGARFQEALCVLSFLYATDGAGNPYFKHPRLLDWIAAAFDYWGRIQYADGSFDEAYPFERSLAATAFTSFYAAEALEFLGADLPAAVRERAVTTLRRGAGWLAANDETHGFLSNHLAAAAAALHHAYRLTGEAAFRQRSRYFRDRILSHQSDEGWYEEYGGADPGYQTHGSFYLARLAHLSDDSALAASLERSMEFLSHFIHPDGSIGGEYASRNTQTYYPAAFEMFAARSGAAAEIADAMRPSLWSGAAAGPRSVDSYNYFPVLNNLVFACLAAANQPGGPPRVRHPPQPGLAWFPAAGLARVRHPRYDAYIGTSKGGVVKVFDRAERKLVYSDCGYLGRMNGGRWCATQYLDPERPVVVIPDRIEVGGGLVGFSRPIMAPGRFLAFRLFSLTAGRVAALSRWLKNFLVKALVYRRQPIAVTFRRTIAFAPDQVTVTDELRGPDGPRLSELRWEPQFTTIHMGSSRYFITSALHDTRVDESSVDVHALRDGITLTRTVRFDGVNR